MAGTSQGRPRPPFSVCIHPAPYVCAELCSAPFAYQFTSHVPLFFLCDGHMCVCCFLSGQLSGHDKVLCPRGSPLSCCELVLCHCCVVTDFLELCSQVTSEMSVLTALVQNPCEATVSLHFVCLGPALWAWEDCEHLQGKRPPIQPRQQGDSVQCRVSTSIFS